MSLLSDDLQNMPGSQEERPSARACQRRAHVRQRRGGVLLRGTEYKSQSVHFCDIHRYGRLISVRRSSCDSNDSSSCRSQQAVVKFHYSVQEEADSCHSGRWSFDDVPMKPYRTVCLIPMERMPVIMDKLKDYLTI